MDRASRKRDNKLRKSNKQKLIKIAFANFLVKAINLIIIKIKLYK